MAKLNKLISINNSTLIFGWKEINDNLDNGVLTEIILNDISDLDISLLQRADKAKCKFTILTEQPNINTFINKYGQIGILRYKS